MAPVVSLVGGAVADGLGGAASFLGSLSPSSTPSGTDDYAILSEPKICEVIDNTSPCFKVLGLTILYIFALSSTTSLSRFSL